MAQDTGTELGGEETRHDVELERLAPLLPLVVQGVVPDQALTELREARKRPYYDEEADRAAISVYYSGLGQGVPPYSALSELVRRTHQPTPRYQPVLQVYPWVDVHPDGKLHSIYSGEGYTPEEFIQRDLQVDLLRVDRFQSLRPLAATLSPEQLEAAWAQLEASLPYNCEHVVPQSWFNKREPMRGDLHHLFACESRCNSFRGNTPYYDFPAGQEAERGKCGRRVENKFEPRQGKGGVARATLYFLLRYPGEINRTAREYEADRLEVLLRWHEEDPVGPYEHHRNQAIFQKQGNRNPLIDFPAWARQVDFRRGLG